MKDLATLKAACDDIINDPNLRPIVDEKGVIVETHCNYGAMRVAKAMGCEELNGMMADDMYKHMDQNIGGKWVKVDGVAASMWANTGGLCIAAMSSEMLHEAHGHVAVCYPAPMEFSGSLNKNVPVIANIGKQDAEEKESMAFPVALGEPDYFTWNG